MAVDILRKIAVQLRARNNPLISRRFLSTNFLICLLSIIVVLQLFHSYNTRHNHSHVYVLSGDKYSRNYESLLKKFTGEQFVNLPLTERCNHFFNQLKAEKHDWKFDDFDTTGHDDNFVNFKEFVEFKKKAEKDLVLDEKTMMKLEEEFNSKSLPSIKNTLKIVDTITAMRVFGKCYIEYDSASAFPSILEDNGLVPTKKSRLDMHMCQDIEARIFPWATGMLPTYKRWNNEIATTLPNLKEATVNYNEYNEGKEYNKNGKRSDSKSNSCFFKEFQKTINGKGIVISASDGQKDDLMRLALVLRMLGNRLPLQIIHKGDLSQTSQDDLIKQFRRKIDTEKILSLANELKISPTNLAFPEQDVWFVNVEKCIDKKYEKHFQKYANKLLAYVFNSFDEMVLIDTDTVPFVNLESLFQLPGYQQKGAFFFPDRQLDVPITHNHANYFKRLFPSKLDKYFFNIPMVTDHTLKNRFIDGLKYHFMESGVVLVKRSTHFMGVITALQLNFWRTTTVKIHGEKELFWLGMSAAGNENYEFNALGAASIGVLSEENSRFPKSRVKEICSNHPGHINGYDNETLLWMNSGFTFCKNYERASKDAGTTLYKNYDAKALEKYYKSMTKIRAALVPPPQEITRKNDRGDPDSGWSDEHKFCRSYTWCAYESVGSQDTDHVDGLLIQFPEEKQEWFDFIGQIWMKGIKE